MTALWHLVNTQGMGRPHAKFGGLWQSFVSIGVRRHRPMAPPANKRPVPDFPKDLQRKTARMERFLWGLFTQWPICVIEVVHILKSLYRKILAARPPPRGACGGQRAGQISLRGPGCLSIVNTLCTIIERAHLSDSVANRSALPAG